MALFGVSGCGVSRGESGEASLIFSAYPDQTGTTRCLVDRFNRTNEGAVQVELREMPADVGQHLDQLRTEFQAGGGDIDVILGSSLWLAQFAANGWISDLSDRFAEDARRRYVDSMITANTYEGSIFGVPWFTEAGLLYHRQDLLEESGFGE